MNFGFLINNESCIGCHACSTACKSENEVPLGVQRTWVKSVETGRYPNVSRSFQVTRCNHCDNPPCVEICPVTAMYRRGDGIVEFDPDECIGCKACMQACPYDAVYIDPDSGTAAKCHYCAHRVDIGLEPACVVVCPAHSILAGDLDDPTTEIAKTIAENRVTVRKPEKGTVPKLFYIGGEEAAMHPTAVARTPETFAWADVIPLHAKNEDSGFEYTQMAEQMTQVVFNAQHSVPWHWQVPAYLVTKGIASGLFAIFALAVLLGFVTAHIPTLLAVGAASLFFLLATTVLLVIDLERPERFLRILFRPQWKSWLVRGAFILIGFSTLTGVWWLSELAAAFGWIGPGFVARLRTAFMAIGIPFAFGTAVYTAFLFGQAKGRDLWQSPLLPVHLVIQAVLAGAAFVPLLGLFTPLDVAFVELAYSVFAVSLGIDLVVMLLGEFGMPHASDAAAAAARAITSGRYARSFWIGNVVVGHIIPMALLILPSAFDTPVTFGGIAAGLCTLTGLYLYEYAFVMAPQDIPNS